MILRGDKMNVSMGDLIDRLSIVNLKIWHLEEQIRAGKEQELTIEKIGKNALEIRDLNRERIALKNAINEEFDTGFKEIKVNHASGESK